MLGMMTSLRVSVYSNHSVLPSLLINQGSIRDNKYILIDIFMLYPISILDHLKRYLVGATRKHDTHSVLCFNIIPLINQDKIMPTHDNCLTSCIIQIKTSAQFFLGLVLIFADTC